MQRNHRGGSGGLFDGKIAPLIPYALRGFVWYQGEANTRVGGADVYGRKVAATSGPLPTKHEVKGADVVVSFTHTNGGLAAKGGALKGFGIAGEDRAWKPANARIEGDKVIVSSAEVKVPVAVRYAWEDNPECNLALPDGRLARVKKRPAR